MKASFPGREWARELMDSSLTCFVPLAGGQDGTSTLSLHCRSNSKKSGDEKVSDLALRWLQQGTGRRTASPDIRSPTAHRPQGSAASAPQHRSPIANRAVPPWSPPLEKSLVKKGAGGPLTSSTRLSSPNTSHQPSRQRSRTTIFRTSIIVPYETSSRFQDAVGRR